MARLGVVFLLFWIGLELSVERILALRRYLFGLGAAQVLVTALVFWAGLRAAGLADGAALIIGAGLSLSSTAVVLRMLVERRELASHHGRLAFAVLLFQDLAVVPLLTLIPLLGGEGARILPALGTAFGKTAIAFIAILVSADWQSGRCCVTLLAQIPRSCSPVSCCWWCLGSAG